MILLRIHLINNIIINIILIITYKFDAQEPAGEILQHEKRDILISHVPFRYAYY